MAKQSEKTGDILLIGFNRPALIEAQLSRLARADWARLFISIDGPRPDRADDEEQIETIRQTVDAWRDRLPGEVVARFHESNVGSCDGVADAITWAFESADNLIILEDDCAPAPDFFGFASTMLERYRDEPKVMSIGGFNPLPEKLRQRIEGDFFFTRHAQFWGWATWRDRWNKFSPVRNVTDVDNLVRQAFTARHEQRRWRKVLQGHYPRALAWDSYWRMACYLHSGLCIVPAENLITNTGMGAGATRTMHVDPALLAPAGSLPAPFVAPTEITADEKIERWYWDTRLAMNLWPRCKRFFRTRIKSRFMNKTSRTDSQ